MSKDKLSDAVNNKESSRDDIISDEALKELSKQLSDEELEGISAGQTGGEAI